MDCMKKKTKRRTNRTKFNGEGGGGRNRVNGFWHIIIASSEVLSVHGSSKKHNSSDISLTAMKQANLITTVGGSLCLRF